MSAQKQLTRWLQQAYALEEAFGASLDEQANTLAADVRLHDRLQAHAMETRTHAAAVRRWLERMGADVPPRETDVRIGTALISTLLGSTRKGGTNDIEDDVLGKVVVACAAEHLEIACFRALATAAEDLEQRDLVRACREMVRTHLDMAWWLEERISFLTSAALARAQAAAPDPTSAG